MAWTVDKQPSSLTLSGGDVSLGDCFYTSFQSFLSGGEPSPHRGSCLDKVLFQLASGPNSSVPITSQVGSWQRTWAQGLLWGDANPRLAIVLQSEHMHKPVMG